jgi:hypothetical protein
MCSSRIVRNWHSESIDAGVRSFLDGIESPSRRRDAETMIELIGRASGELAAVSRSTA